jgi:SAM-dependent methyltransferase
MGKKGSTPLETWASGEAYESYVGRWSRVIARKFLQWIAIPADRLWLDVGCGTGALAQVILESAAPQSVTGVDSAPGLLALARERVSDNRAIFQPGDAQALPVESATYDVIVSGFALNFFPQPDRAVIEMARAARPGGRIAAYVWDYAGKAQFMRHFWNAAAALDPRAATLDEGRRFPLCNPEPLSSLFRSAGLTGVEVTPIDIWTVFRDFDDYWSPFHLTRMTG